MIVFLYSKHSLFLSLFIFAVLWSAVVVSQVQDDLVTQHLVIHTVRVNSSKSRSIESDGTVQKLLKFEDIRKNERDLEEASQIVREFRMKSVCVQAGLWAMFKSKNYVDIAAVLYASSRRDDQACTNDKLNISSYMQYKSVRHIGNSALLLPGLSLYLEKFFGGEELYFDGTELDLIEPQTFRSFGFTGPFNWTVYSNTNFNGDATCLLAYTTADGATYDRVAYNKDIVGLNVGSVRRGCFRSNGGRSMLVYPTGEKRLNLDTTVAVTPQISAISPSLTLTASNSTQNPLFTDGPELKLPAPQTFLSTPKLSEDWSWTVFTGIEFDGKSKCFFSGLKPEPDSSEFGNTNTSNTLSNERDTTTTTMLVGSIKSGCHRAVEASQRKPRLLLPPTPIEEDKDKLLEGNSRITIFFISFLIGLAFLILLVILLIYVIIYAYVSKRKGKVNTVPPPISTYNGSGIEIRRARLHSGSRTN